VRFSLDRALTPAELDDAQERDLIVAGVLCRQIPTADGWYVRAQEGALEWQLGEGEDGADGRTFLRLLASTGAVRVPTERPRAG
jgi:hypothetical protein